MARRLLPALSMQWLDELRHDPKSGARQLASAPMFSLIAILTLALGIGANAAIFGVVKSVLLDALPYRDSDRLVRIWGGVRTSPQVGPVTAGTVAELAARQHSFSSMAAFDAGSPDDVMEAADGPRIVRRAWVEPRLFETLGVTAVLGRTLNASDVANGLAPLSGNQLTPDTSSTMMVTDSGWRQLFAADPAILGRAVRINGQPRTIVGVLPQGFIGPMGPADFYVALDLAPVVAHPVFARRSGWLGLVARLRPGATLESARDDVAAIWKDFAAQYPEDNGSLGMDTVLLRQAMVGDSRTPLLVLIASAGLVLLIACANLAAALLSRALARRKEFALRIALGAGGGRVVRQLLTESVLLSACGGLLGLLLAMGGLQMLRTLAASALPSYANLRLDPGAIAITAAVALATGLLFGLAPALAAGGRRPSTALIEEGRGSSESRRARHLRGLLMAGQLALCVSLLVGAGLLARSLWAMTSTPIGIRTDGVLTASVQLSGDRYTTADARGRFQQTLLERVRRIPGVSGAASATSLPTTAIGSVGVSIQGQQTPQGAQPFVLGTIVSHDYFATLQIPLREGRFFNAGDRADSPQVAVISESMARRFWPQGNAIGAHMRLGPDGSAPWIEVIGIAGDVRNDRTRADAAPIVYGAAMQNSPARVRLLIRTGGDPLALIPQVRQALAELDGDLPLQNPAALDTVAGEALTSRRMPAFLIVSFGLLALVLASVGVYAMFANMAAAREREFGIRLALGAQPAEIAALVVRQGVWWMVVGLAGGAVGVAVVVQLVSELLYGVRPLDPVTLGGASTVLVCCAALAIVVPLYRATHVDPVQTLRG